MDPTLKCGHYTQWYSAEENWFFFPFASAYQLHIASGLEVQAHVHSPLSVPGPHLAGWNLCSPCACCHGLSEFICAPVLCIQKKMFHQSHPPPLALRIFLPLLPIRSQVLEGRDLMRTSDFAPRAPRSRTLCTPSSCRSCFLSLGHIFFLYLEQISFSKLQLIHFYGKEKNISLLWRYNRWEVGLQRHASYLPFVSKIKGARTPASQMLSLSVSAVAMSADASKSKSGN